MLYNPKYHVVGEMSKFSFFFQIVLDISLIAVKFTENLGGHTGGETPGPIPNPEVKPSKADDTAPVREWESR